MSGEREIRFSSGQFSSKYAVSGEEVYLHKTQIAQQGSVAVLHPSELRWPACGKDSRRHRCCWVQRAKDDPGGEEWNETPESAGETNDSHEIYL
jgi:hypothetical protein